MKTGILLPTVAQCPPNLVTTPGQDQRQEALLQPCVEWAGQSAFYSIKRWLLLTSTDCVHGDVPAPVPADQNTAARERLGEPGGLSRYYALILRWETPSSAPTSSTCPPSPTTGRRATCPPSAPPSSTCTAPPATTRCSTTPAPSMTGWGRESPTGGRFILVDNLTAY